MRTSPSLFIRSVLNAINPPLPPQSARETRRLVGVLKSAFQKHLDETHPSPKTISSSATSQEENSIPDPAHHATRAAHTHLANLLAHPLLQKNVDVSSPTGAWTHTAVRDFENVVIGNSLDRAPIRKCCHTYLRGLNMGEVVPQGRQLSSRLVSWYTQMNTTERLAFLGDLDTLRQVVPVLYAENLESEVWEWLRTLYEHAQSIKTTGKTKTSVSVDDMEAIYQSRAEDNLISLMIVQSASVGGLNAAAQQFFQAYKYNDSRMATMRSSHIQLHRSWDCLFYAILYRHERHAISPALYDEILTFAAKMNRLWTGYSACLQIYHPTSPSARPLITFLKSPDFSAQTFLVAGPALLGKESRISYGFLRYAAKLAYQQGFRQDAQWLREFEDSLRGTVQISHSTQPKSQPKPAHKMNNPLGLGLAWT